MANDQLDNDLEALLQRYRAAFIRSARQGLRYAEAGHVDLMTEFKALASKRGVTVAVIKESFWQLANETHDAHMSDMRRAKRERAAERARESHPPPKRDRGPKL